MRETETTLAIEMRIEGELSGTAIACDGHVLRGSSPKAFPPGKPLLLELLPGAAPLPLATRVIGSKKRDDGSFELRVRLVNLRKEARARLNELFSIES
jgi:hypothetical protein